MIDSRTARDSTLPSNDRIAIYRLNKHLVKHVVFGCKHTVELIIGKVIYTGFAKNRGGALREAENNWRSHELVLEGQVQTGTSSVRREVLPTRQP